MQKSSWLTLSYHCAFAAEDSLLLLYFLNWLAINGEGSFGDLGIRFPIVHKNCRNLEIAYIEDQSFGAKCQLNLSSSKENLLEKYPYLHLLWHSRLKEKSHSEISRRRKRQKHVLYWLTGRNVYKGLLGNVGIRSSEAWGVRLVSST